MSASAPGSIDPFRGKSPAIRAPFVDEKRTNASSDMPRRC